MKTDQSEASRRRVGGQILEPKRNKPVLQRKGILVFALVSLSAAVAFFVSDGGKGLIEKIQTDSVVALDAAAGARRDDR